MRLRRSRLRPDYAELRGMSMNGMRVERNDLAGVIRDLQDLDPEEEVMSGHYRGVSLGASGQNAPAMRAVDDGPVPAPPAKDYWGRLRESLQRQTAAVTGEEAAAFAFLPASEQRNLLLEAMTKQPPKQGMSSLTLLAIGASVLGAVYFLFFRKKR